MTTQNGPKTLPIVASAHTVLFGSFYNAKAVSDAALEIALTNNLDEIAIVCAGQEGLEGLDDTLTAGFLARHARGRASQHSARVVRFQTRQARHHQVCLSVVHQPKLWYQSSHLEPC